MEKGIRKTLIEKKLQNDHRSILLTSTSKQNLTQKVRSHLRRGWQKRNEMRMRICSVPDHENESYMLYYQEIYK